MEQRQLHVLATASNDIRNGSEYEQAKFIPSQGGTTMKHAGIKVKTELSQVGSKVEN
ncbi:hypothetical protein CCACVL1_27949 [Corchorus capsularis]|uniref:Uncharacterized protein n=1 Tax=Corchorus capsularis TaxID=210143 RepID=A0A1R3G810_COCAP|nr:hypothetical protein CCACVL1_27949 [Corchorus capsularis]